MGILGEKSTSLIANSKLFEKMSLEGPREVKFRIPAAPQICKKQQKLIEKIRLNDQKCLKNLDEGRLEQD